MPRIETGTSGQSGSRVLSAAIMLLLLYIANPCQAQTHDLDRSCVLLGDLDSKSSEQVDKKLLEIDKLASTADLAANIQKMLEAGEGALNYCEIERRLRKLNAQTRLLGLPVEKIAGQTNEIGLAYTQPIFPTWSSIPEYAIWYERKGEDVALRRLRDASIDPAQNLRNLNRTGALVEAQSFHKAYVLTAREDRSSLNPMYKSLYDSLDRYRTSGFLNDHHDSALMFAADPYVASVKGLRFSINGRFDGSVLQFFVIDRDPDRLLAGMSCNCAYIPKTNLIRL